MAGDKQLERHWRIPPRLIEAVVFCATLREGLYDEEIHGLLAYMRDGEKKIMVLANLNNHEVTIEVPEASDNIIINNMHYLNINNGRIMLEPWQACMIEYAQD